MCDEQSVVASSSRSEFVDQMVECTKNGLSIEAIQEWLMKGTSVAFFR